MGHRFLYSDMTDLWAYPAAAWFLEMRNDFFPVTLKCKIILYCPIKREMLRLLKYRGGERN